MIPNKALSCRTALTRKLQICTLKGAAVDARGSVETVPAYLLSQLILLLQLLTHLLLLLLPVLIWQESSVSGGILPNACQLCAPG